IYQYLYKASLLIRRQADFGSVSTQSKFKKCAAYFLKVAKAAPVQVRSLPAEEAKPAMFKELK
ncbi:MAG: hypothetical protein ABI091_08635, partial [Ferruginibacter sp.]